MGVYKILNKKRLTVVTDLFCSFRRSVWRNSRRILAVIDYLLRVLKYLISVSPAYPTLMKESVSILLSVITMKHITSLLPLPR
jgi:hypothetical protein